ncbi:homeodomain-like protein [Tanacetum coccineum]
MSKVLQERGFGSLPSSTETNPRDQVKLISTTIEADSHSIRRIGSSQYAVSTGHNSTLFYKSRQTTIPFPSCLDNHYCEEEEGNYEPKFAEAYGASHINDTIPRKEKDPGSFTLPCYFNNVCFDNALVDSGISENVLVGIGKFVFPVDFIILDMPKDIKVPLILERPFLSITRAKIDVYKRKITLTIGEEKIIFKSVKLASSLIKRVYMWRNLGDDLMPMIEECEVIKEVRTRDDELDTEIVDYPRFEFTHVNFFLLLYLNVMSKKFHNSIMKDKMVYKGDNVVGALMKVPIFVRTFSVVTDYAVLEDMDAYRDEGMGDVIVGEPFLREVGIKARQFDGMITIYNGNDEVTYQMVRSHPRFKRHTNEQCNKIPPLLKVSEKDKKNGISHAYQKLKGFYKGVLNIGPDYIRNAKTEEWLTRGHISVHEME